MADATVAAREWGPSLRARRSAKGVSAQEPARAVGAREPVVPAWEAGRRPLSAQARSTVDLVLEQLPLERPAGRAAPAAAPAPERLAAARASLWLDMKRMAAEVGVSAQVWRRWELGPSAPSERNQRKLEAALRRLLEDRKEGACA